MVMSSPKSDSGIVRETHPNPTKDDDNQINQDVSNKDEPNHNHNNNNNNNTNNNHVLKNLFSPRRSPSRFSIMKSPSQVSLGNQSRMSSIAELEDDSMHSLKMVHQTPPNERGILFKQSFSIRPKQENKSRNIFNKLKSNRELFANGSNQSSVFAVQNSEDRPNLTTYHHQKIVPRQYIFSSKKHRNTLWAKFLNQINPDEYNYEPTGWIVSYINWTFRTNFFSVFMSFLIVFMFLIFTFGVFLMFAGMGKGQCFIVGDGDFTITKAGLADGFALSWTTFTTVGYGAVYPATGNEYEQQIDCIWITIITTTESFVGLLYAGMCAAILFGKVGRIQSHAQVRFSDAICIEYGKEDRPSVYVPQDYNLSKRRIRQDLSSSTFDSSEVRSNDESFTKDVKYKCPVLKFQLVNELSNQPCGEILDAELCCVIRKEDESSLTNEAYARFSTVKLEESTHPFFNQVWQGCHILNEESPLLSRIAKDKIIKNGGYWPAQWANTEDIRKYLNFSVMIVTMTGLSNISASSVQIARRFHKHDVLIGYDYAPMLYKKQGSKEIKVDMTLINDVVEQIWAVPEILSEHSDQYEYPSLRQSLRFTTPSFDNN